MNTVKKVFIAMLASVLFLLVLIILGFLFAKFTAIFLLVVTFIMLTIAIYSVIWEVK